MILRLSLLGLVCLNSCSDPSFDEPKTGDSVASAAHAGPWEYLVETYDADADGRVTREEHGRTARSFQRLDRDGDGVLTAVDFARRPKGGQRKAADRAVQLIGRYLQHDTDGGHLDTEELQAAFARLDTDDDGELNEEEFRCGQLAAGDWGPERTQAVAKLLENVDPWDGLLRALDVDGDGALASSELVDFHRERGKGQPWTWETPTEAQLLAQRPLLGQPAPDFTLSPLQGGPEVTLSSFHGHQPVALIFGSYT